MIDIRINSTNNYEYNLSSDIYCNSRWTDIKWKRIFDIINFKVTLLYNNKPNYWSVDQVKSVFESLLKLHRRHYDDFMEYDYDTGKLVIPSDFQELEEDFDILYLIFKEYVENSCIIIIN